MDSLSKFLSQCVTVGGGLMSSAFGAAALTSGSPTVIGLAVFSLGTTLLGSIS